MGMDSSNKDFRGKDLRGRSFKGQDLAGADFSDAKLGGVNFSGADLTGAKFCRAVMGHSRKGKLGLWGFQLLAGSIFGMGMLVGMAYLVFSVQDLLEAVGLQKNWHPIEISSFFSLASSFFIFLAVQRKRLDYILGYFFSLALFAGAGAVAVAGAVTVTAAGAVTAAGGITTLVAIAIASGAAAAGTGALAAAATAVVMATITGTSAGTEAVAGAVAAAVAAAFFLLLGIYLNHRAITREEPQLLLLHRWHLFINSIGATRFAGQISHADFSGANLRYTNFTDVQFRNCTWQNATHLHLARTRGTLLGTRQVRQLLTTGKSDTTDFSGMDLSGADFAGMDLQGYNFSHANVTGANFCATTLTGAIIENWNIDPHTRFDENIICDHVWLGPKKDSNERERNPPTGHFKPGEFAKLYQQVASTIDFILHSRDELDAILRSIAHLNAHDANIEVESAEHKNGAVVLRLKAPPGTNREQIYTEVKQEFKLQLALAEKEVQMLTRERDILSTLLIGMTQNPAKIIVNNHNQQEQNVNDNRRTQIVKENTFTQSAVSFGDHASITQSIASLPESQTELKTLLTQLTTLIEQSTAPTADKQDALHQTAIIIEAAQQTETPQPGRIRRALGYISTIFTSIENASDTATRIFEVINKIQGLLEP